MRTFSWGIAGLLLLAAAGWLWWTSRRPPTGPVGADCRQLITVVTPDWPETTAVLRMWERSGGAWQAAFPDIPAVVGRNGLAWGRGRHAAAPEARPMKHEGDGRAPAGVFSLTEFFGAAPPDSAGALGLPYRQMTPDFAGVDDPASRYYNRIVDSRTVTPDWNSAEKMVRDDDLYQWGVVVAHNEAQVPGGGSCIFVHTWSGPGRGTAGCTAMARENLVRLLRWLDSSQAPLIVQLPEGEYRKRQAAWDLPPL